MEQLPIPSSPPTLLTLPQELEDIVFHLAFRATDDGSKSVQEVPDEEYQALPGSADHARYIIRPMICDYMVSKKFFIVAARASISDQAFDDRFRYWYRTSLPVYRLPGVTHAFMTSLKLLLRQVNKRWEPWLLPPNLKHVEVMVDGELFNACVPRPISSPWEIPALRSQLHDAPNHATTQRLSIDLLSEAIDANLLDQFSGLRKLCLTSYPWTETWALNVQRLEDLLQPIVTRPRVEALQERLRAGANTRLPLYQGSAVMVEVGSAEVDDRIAPKESSQHDTRSTADAGQ
jgi:hypothetical protein